MARITGRSDDMLIIRGVNVFPSQIEELILKRRGLSPHYYLELKRESHLDEMTVHLEAIDGCDSASDARAFERDVKAMIGISVCTALHAPGQIERSTGKARRVVDHRVGRQ